MDYPIYKYRFIHNDNKVIALSTYAGKTVRGTATCSKDDEFSLDKGKKLAAARCALKVAKKRAQRADLKYYEACKNVAKAREYCDNMSNYMINARRDWRKAKHDLDALLEMFEMEENHL